MSVNGWPIRPLGKCAKFLSGGTPSKAKAEFWEGDIPWVSSGEMSETHITDTALHITAEAAQAGSRIVPPNTVLAVVRGMSLAKEFRVSITQKEMAFNQDLKAFTCVPDVNSVFLFYALQAQKEYIRDLATEASHGTKKLDTDVLENVAIAVPSLEIQKRVISVLTVYDDLIENNRRRMALLEQSARLLYEEWFVRLRFPGHEHTRIVEGAPSGWSKIPLDEVLILQRGFDLPSQDRIDGDIPIYGASGINGRHNLARVTGPGIVTGRAGSLGIVHFVHGDFWPLNTSLWVKEFRLATPLFALHLLRAMKLERYGQGATMPMLDRKVVHKVEVLVPPPSVMKIFESFAADIQRQVQTLELNSEKLRAARDLLLPRLMSGELVA